jgi:hypothetical protein
VPNSGEIARARRIVRPHYNFGKEECQNSAIPGQKPRDNQPRSAIAKDRARKAKICEPRFREETPVTRQVEEIGLLFLAVMVRAFPELRNIKSASRG